MEQEQESAAVSRGQHQLHVVPEDWHAAAAAIAPLLDRLEASATAIQLLIISSDADASAGIAGRIAPAAAERGLRTIAATDTRRATRVLRASPSHIVIATAPVFVELQQSATLKLDAVKAVVLAWVDGLGASGTRALETLMAELPKDAPRIVLVSDVTPGVEQLVERYARRARRMQPAAADGLRPVALSYVTTTDEGRAQMVRRVLDAIDAAATVIVARKPESLATAEAMVRSLGYGSPTDAVRVAAAADGKPEMVVLFDAPSTEEELRVAVGDGSPRVVALVAPRQVASLRRLAGGTIAPLVLPDAAMRARSREDGLRDELRAMLASGQFSRELISLEPLLAQYDGAEIAAAALRLLETERAKPVVTSSAPAAPQAMTRLYVNVGSTDNVRPGDLVGAMTNEAGVTKSELGKVDVRERHSTVEVATSVANTVVTKLTGISIRGRRVVARVDEDRERPSRPARPPRRDDARSASRERPRKR